MKRILLLLALFAGVTVWAQEPATHEEEGDPLAVWKWANFLLLAGGLGYVIAKTVPPIFRTRTSEIQKGIAEAQTIKADAEKRAAAINARLQSLGTEIEKLRAQSKADMEQEAARLGRETVAAIEKMEQQAAFEIETAGKLAQKELKQYAASLALDLAEQRIRARLDASSEAALIDQFVSDLGSTGARNAGIEN